MFSKTDNSGRRQQEVFPAKIRVDVARDLELSHGFLDYLVSKDVLDITQNNDLRTNQLNLATDQLNHKVLDCIDNGNLDIFLEALRQSNQEHLANYIEKKGVPQSIDEDDWPLPEFIRAAIRKCYPSLTAEMSPRGLLDALHSRGCLSHNQLKSFEGSLLQIECEKNRHLLGLLNNRSIRQFYIFMECLKEAHHHLAEALQKEIDNQSNGVASTPASCKKEELMKKMAGIEIGSDLRVPSQETADELRSGPGEPSSSGQGWLERIDERIGSASEKASHASPCENDSKQTKEYEISPATIVPEPGSAQEYQKRMSGSQMRSVLGVPPAHPGNWQDAIETAEDDDAGIGLTSISSTDSEVGSDVELLGSLPSTQTRDYVILDSTTIRKIGDSVEVEYSLKRHSKCSQYRSVWARFAQIKSALL